jgi:hypothetical protein
LEAGSIIDEGIRPSRISGGGGGETACEVYGEGNGISFGVTSALAGGAQSHVEQAKVPIVAGCQRPTIRCKVNKRIEHERVGIRVYRIGISNAGSLRDTPRCAPKNEIARSSIRPARGEINDKLRRQTPLPILVRKKETGAAVVIAARTNAEIIVGPEGDSAAIFVPWVAGNALKRRGSAYRYIPSNELHAGDVYLTPIPQARGMRV